VTKAKHRAADQLAKYIEQRRQEIAAGSPRLIDIATRGLAPGPDRAARPAPPAETETLGGATNESFVDNRRYHAAKITDEEKPSTASL